MLESIFKECGEYSCSLTHHAMCRFSNQHHPGEQARSIEAIVSGQPISAITVDLRNRLPLGSQRDKVWSGHLSNG